MKRENGMWEGNLVRMGGGQLVYRYELRNEIMKF